MTARLCQTFLRVAMPMMVCLLLFGSLTGCRARTTAPELPFDNENVESMRNGFDELADSAD